MECVSKAEKRITSVEVEQQCISRALFFFWWICRLSIRSHELCQRDKSPREGPCRGRGRGSRRRRTPSDIKACPQTLALVSLPPRLHTLLNTSAKKPKCPAARFFFLLLPPPFFLYTPCLCSDHTCLQRLRPLALLGGICEKHDAVKLMLKELSGCRKMRGEE